ncbi:ABC transporter ATP-binding protein [Longivirga aurantiaca]|uniref:ATP-binding cassette domain-containing protein n=1 Tax=Longivirga aurantiaca TaxID=1837743 RepID=A0ABW1T6H5_9ACTN
MGTDVVIDIQGLVKHYGTTKALDGLDLQVRRGEVHGFLGPNGAGKTTTLRVMLGTARADAGAAVVLGMDPWRDSTALHARLAYVPGDVALWPNLTGGEVIDLMGRLQGGHDRTRRDELLEMFELDPTKKSRSYSKGNRQKVALVAALASDAEVFLLDEPTSGLDPLMEESFRGYVRRLRTDGRTVLLSSHVLAEVDAVCDRVSIVRAGRTVETGSLADLRHLQRMTVVAVTEHTLHGIEDVDGLHDVRHQGNELHCTVEPRALNELVSHLAAAGIVTLESRPPSLEELFLGHYELATTEAAPDA